MRKFFLSLILCLGIHPTAHAVEVQSLLLKGCELVTGLIVGMEDKQLTTLQLNGESRMVDVEKIEAIYVYSIHTNPIAPPKFDQHLKSSLKRVEIGDSLEFLGWPVRFVESLVIFHDIAGNQQVHELDSITQIRPVYDLNLKMDNTYRHTPAQFSARDLSSKCPNLSQSNSQSNRPIRVLSDPIKVRQFLGELSQGYGAIRDYEERTYLYALPFLFEKSSRFGIQIAEQKIDRQLLFPFSYQWSSGKPFHFQSFNQFGAVASEFSPYATPYFGFRSDMKAHIFHMHFEGDFRGLSAGSPIYSPAGYENDHALFGSWNNFGGKSEVQNGFNYLLLMGVDYGPLTLSVGYYYPVQFMRVSTGTQSSTAREVLSNRKTYAFRVMWTKKRWRARVLFSPVMEFSAATPTENDIRVNERFWDAQARLLLPTSYSFKGSFSRAGLDLNFPEIAQFSFDMILHKGEYQDVSPAAYGYTGNKMSFERMALLGSIRKDFGDYVGVKMVGGINQLKTSHSFGGVSGTNEWSPQFFGGALEFVF